SQILPILSGALATSGHGGGISPERHKRTRRRGGSNVDKQLTACGHKAKSLQCFPFSQTRGLSFLWACAVPRHSLPHNELINSVLRKMLSYLRDYDYSLKYDFSVASYDKSLQPHGFHPRLSSTLRSRCNRFRSSTWRAISSQISLYMAGSIRRFMLTHPSTMNSGGRKFPARICCTVVDLDSILPSWKKDRLPQAAQLKC